MGDSKGSFTNLELNEGKKESVQTPQLLGDTLTSRASHDVFRQSTSNVAEACGFSSNDDLMKQLTESAKPGDLPQCKAIVEKRGPIEVTKDECGEIVKVKDANFTYIKDTDGKWIQRDNGGRYKDDKSVTNMKVDEKGNVSYDYNDDARNVHVHHEHNADGSMSFTDENGKLTYNEKGQVVEAGSGNGRQRHFHYDEKGQLDQIDGNLGHWDRQVKDGHVSWVNKDSGVVWNGDFKMVLDRLQYRGDDGGAWEFTPWGTDIKIEKEP